MYEKAEEVGPEIREGRMSFAFLSDCFLKGGEIAEIMRDKHYGLFWKTHG
jgi:hypothetical protein